MLVVGEAWCRFLVCSFGEDGKAPGVCGEEKHCVLPFKFFKYIWIPCWCMGFLQHPAVLSWVIFSFSHWWFVLFFPHLGSVEPCWCGVLTQTIPTSQDIPCQRIFRQQRLNMGSQLKALPSLSSSPRAVWCFPACPFGFVAQILCTSLSSAKTSSTVWLLVVSHLTLAAILGF